MTRRSRTSSTRVVLVAALAAALFSFGGVGPASADGPTSTDPVASGQLLASVTSPDGSYIEKTEIINGLLYVFVHSAAMDKTFPVLIQRPADTSEPRPVLYLLNGAGGGEDLASWQSKTDAMTFLADKNINVVTPIGGKWSYYADWKQPDPVLGVNKWKTFLTQELPPLIDAGLGTNGKNAIAGLSTSGTTVLSLPEAAPGLYQSAAAYSGCAQISDPVGQQFVKLAVETWGGGDTRNMYGASNDPMWAANDPYVHAEKLRGLALYISNGNGLPGPYDTLNGPYALPGPDGLANQVVIGGIIEAGTNFCTHNLQTRLNELGIPAHFNLPPVGTHSWGYWQDDLKDSWPIISAPLGI
ncbi:alpha/beta hydrolase [Antrihabitans stalactiti]|uniref:alpha/beta hydrolase n=1 Tax=Antrihabitans stalactiti TaxID=2584121 RepID=UPI003B8477A3